jgi:hypothetical protein
MVSLHVKSYSVSSWGYQWYELEAVVRGQAFQRQAKFVGKREWPRSFKIQMR